MGEWQSVDVLPPPCIRVLIVESDGLVRLAHMDAVGVWWNEVTALIMNPTHWMPLPEPPPLETPDA